MPRPAAFYHFFAAGLLLSGCSVHRVSSSVEDRPGAAVPALAAAPAAETTLSAPETITLQWECEPQAGVITGLECSTNLATWTRLCEWPATMRTNTFTDTKSAPARFYRAFTDWGG